MKCNLPKESTPAKSNFQLNLYDINKQIYSQQKDLENIRDKQEIFDNYCDVNEGKYFMLLCNELKYYTIFAYNSHGENSYGKEAIDCLEYFCDSVKDITFNEETNTIEIWFTKEGETYMMLFFDYTFGVIECHD